MSREPIPDENPDTVAEAAVDGTAVQSGVTGGLEVPAPDRIERGGGATDSRELAFDLYRRSIDQLFALADTGGARPGWSTNVTGSVIEDMTDRQRRCVKGFRESAEVLERYPGEAFRYLCRNSPAPAPTPEMLVADIGMSATDVVLLQGKSTERKFELFRRLFGAVAGRGVVVSTKYVAEDIRESFGDPAPTVVDCTSACDRRDTPAGSGIRHVDGDNLTRVGTEVLDSLDSATVETRRMLGLYALEQLGSLRPDVRTRFLNVLTGKLRNRGVGAIVASEVGWRDDGRRAPSEQFDYTVTLRRRGRGVDELCVSGKLGTTERWRPVRLD